MADGGRAETKCRPKYCNDFKLGNAAPSCLLFALNELKPYLNKEVVLDQI